MYKLYYPYIQILLTNVLVGILLISSRLFCPLYIAWIFLLETSVYPVDIQRFVLLIYCETYSCFQAHTLQSPNKAVDLLRLIHSYLMWIPGYVLFCTVCISNCKTKYGYRQCRRGLFSVLETQIKTRDFSLVVEQNSRILQIL